MVTSTVYQLLMFPPLMLARNVKAFLTRCQHFHLTENTGNIVCLQRRFVFHFLNVTHNYTHAVTLRQSAFCDRAFTTRSQIAKNDYWLRHARLSIRIELRSHGQIMTKFDI